MCKSQAEGGQRCATDAKKDLDAAAVKVQALTAAVERGEATEEQLTKAHEACAARLVEYASTIDGANDLYRRFHNTDPNDIDTRLSLVGAIDEGAKLAQVNREVENAYRATQGKGPLTTPLPQTMQQMAEQKAERERQAAEEAARKADPLGLRAAQKTAKEDCARETADLVERINQENGNSAPQPTTYFEQAIEALHENREREERADRRPHGVELELDLPAPKGIRARLRRARQQTQQEQLSVGREWSFEDNPEAEPGIVSPNQLAGSRRPFGVELELARPAPKGIRARLRRARPQTQPEQPHYEGEWSFEDNPAAKPGIVSTHHPLG